MVKNIKIEYDWEKDLIPFTSQDNINKLVKIVNNKIKSGVRIKWLIIGGDIIFTVILMILLGALNLINQSVDTRVLFTSGIITFELAVITFLSPIQFQGSTLTREEVDSIIDTAVTNAIMAKIQKSLGQKTSGIQKWLAVIGACGVLAGVCLKVL